MLTVAFANQKGGVGKTTTVLGLASAAQAHRVRTLVIDMDPQANSTAALGLNGEGQTINDVLASGQRGGAQHALWDSEWGEHLTVIPSGLDLAQRDSDTTLGTELRLRKALDDEDFRSRFDLCLIDCPPSLGKLVSNALIAADAIVVVTEPSFMASQGVAKITETVETVRDNYNPGLVLAGVIVNRVPARSREAGYRTSEIEEVLGDLVWTPYMPTRTALAEAAGNNVPIHQHTPRAADCIDIYDGYLRRVLDLAGGTADKTDRQETRA